METTYSTWSLGEIKSFYGDQMRQPGGKPQRCPECRGHRATHEVKIDGRWVCLTCARKLYHAIRIADAELEREARAETFRAEHEIARNRSNGKPL